MRDRIGMGVVRFYSQGGAVVGAGFLVGERVVATCAHVLNQARGKGALFEERPLEPFTLDFPLLAGGEKFKTGELIVWQPQREQDLAFLELDLAPDKSLPVGAEPLPLVLADELHSRSFETFGFPKHTPDGVWAEGKLQRIVGGGRVQIEGSDESGYRVMGGFSGAPVWDRQAGGVVGQVVTSDEAEKEARAAFMTPAQALVAAYAPLQERAIHIRSVPVPRPEGFVERPEVYQALLDQLTGAEVGRVAITSTLALSGAGGYGKTMLAQALVHDEAVWRTFPDGIFWVTLGETADVPTAMSGLYEALMGEGHVFINDHPESVQMLAGAWGTRRCLLVIDDVWNEVHLRPFLEGGQACTRLITTRLSHTLPDDAVQIDVDEMEEAEALALLGGGLPAGEEKALKELAGRLGEWPLLLGLANGALREHVHRWKRSLEGAIGVVNGDLTEFGLTAFDADDAAGRNQAVRSSLGVTVDLLGKEARYGRIRVDEQACYYALAIFPEDIMVPQPALARIWSGFGLSSGRLVGRLCERLAGLKLVREYDAATGAIRLHDVVRQYLLDEQWQVMPALHERLLEAYEADGQEGWGAK